jgi:phage host-nuclease inhibitor protein Gam
MNALLQNELQETEYQEGFEISNLDQATWAFRKIRALKAQISDNNRIADAEIEHIETWRHQENKGAKESVGYFESLLTEYFKTLKEQDPKAKVSTPFGKISSRKSVKWHYQNEEEILKYLTANGYQNLIRVKREVDKTELKKQFKNGVDQTSGECIPGIEIVPEESISISVE